MWSVFTKRVFQCTLVVVLKGGLEVRVGTVFDNDLGSLRWGETAQVSKPLLRDQYLHIVFCMIDVGYHWYNAGNLTVLCLRWRHEYGDIGIAGEIA